jgi:hypothetical protein
MNSKGERRKYAFIDALPSNSHCAATAFGNERSVTLNEAPDRSCRPSTFCPRAYFLRLPNTAPSPTVRGGTAYRRLLVSATGNHCSSSDVAAFIPRIAQSAARHSGVRHCSVACLSSCCAIIGAGAPTRGSRRGPRLGRTPLHRRFCSRCARLPHFCGYLLPPSCRHP